MTGHKFRRPDAECISHAELKRRFEYVGKAGLRRKNSRRGKTGNVNTTGYVRVQIDGKSYLMHRAVWFFHKKKWPLEINHLDGDKLNCAIENLEDCTRKANQTHALGKPCAKCLEEERNKERRTKNGYTGARRPAPKGKPAPTSFYKMLKEKHKQWEGTRLEKSLKPPIFLSPELRELYAMKRESA